MIKSAMQALKVQQSCKDPEFDNLEQRTELAYNYVCNGLAECVQDINNLVELLHKNDLREFKVVTARGISYHTDVGGALMAMRRNNDSVIAVKK